MGIKNTKYDMTILNKFEIKDMNDWEGVNADLIITDPPFGIDFSGKNGNYHRKAEYVVDGYMNLKENAQTLIFYDRNNKVKDSVLPPENHVIWKSKFGLVSKRGFVTICNHFPYMCVKMQMYPCKERNTFYIESDKYAI
ncbi:MAG: hypothetical protein QW620_07465 [Thermoplasmata archaeon]